MADVVRTQQPTESKTARDEKQTAIVPSELFPLRVTPLEHFLIEDDVPAQPLTAFVQLTFAGPLNFEKLESAIHQALHRNPLLAARIVPDGKSWQWHYDASFRPAIERLEHHPPVINGRIVPLDLRAAPGVRVWYSEQCVGSRLIFQFHHACADGIGMRRFALDMLICYARSFATVDDPIHAHLRLDRLDHARLKARGSLKHLVQNPAPRPLTAWQRAKNSYYFFFQPPVPLQGTMLSYETALPSSTEPTVVLKMNAEESTFIVNRARELGVGLNELGLAILFHQCRWWHVRHGTRGPRQRIRLLMPYDIRTKEDLRLSAANRLSFAFLGRTHRQCDDWSTLLASVQSETQAIKDSRVYLDFLRCLQSGQQHPVLFRWLLRRCRHMATAVFTYGGDIHRGLSRIFHDENGYKRVGDALWDDVVAAPPVRSNTNISLGFCIAHGRICMSAAWNREVLSPDEAQQFLALYADAWRAWAKSGHPSTHDQLTAAATC